MIINKKLFSFKNLSQYDVGIHVSTIPYVSI